MFDFLYQRAYSIRTRIKTLSLCKFINSLAIREHIPLEQGLRLLISLSVAATLVYQRAYSIRTRIKTNGFLIIEFCPIYQRAYSIRTRIKTTPESIAVAYNDNKSESIFH